MSQPILWAFGFALGLASVLATAFGLTGAIVVALLVIPVARRPGGEAAVSGQFTGFGALWLLLTAAQSSSGGVLDNATFWTAVGVVALAIGLALLVRIVRSAAPWSSETI